MGEITYPIAEVFRSIQGEGYHAGRPAVFVRFAGCNLSCPFCFGVRPGRRIPHVILADRPSVHITDVKVGDIALTYNEDLELVETKVTNVLRREVTQWYSLLIDGREYFVTPEHPFFTARGMVRADNLQVGDQILHGSPEGKQRFYASHYNSMSDPAVAKLKASHTDYREMGRKLSRTIAKKKSLGSYIPAFNQLSLEQQNQIRRRLSESRMGELNPNWKGGKDRNFQQLKKECKEGRWYACEVCGKSARLVPHHVDEDHANDSPDNLMCVCHPCHNKIHKRGYNFWTAGRKDGKVLARVVQANGLKVQAKKFVDIETDLFFGRSYGPKPLQVYNLSCSPYNTYFADYMWVHNCDTDHSVKEHLTACQLAESVEKLRNPTGDFTVLTGGEPCLHDIQTVIRHLNGPVAIETNGTEMPSLLRCKQVWSSRVWITVSPKRGHFQADSLWYADEVKVVYDGDEFLDKVNCRVPPQIFNERRAYIQPCSGNIQPALDYVMAHPWWRLSLQTQKMIGVR
jgi:organic radical activating enzyme